MCQPPSMDFRYTKWLNPHTFTYKVSTIIISLGLEVTHWYHGLLSQGWTRESPWVGLEKGLGHSSRKFWDPSIWWPRKEGVGYSWHVTLTADSLPARPLTHFKAWSPGKRPLLPRFTGNTSLVWIVESFNAVILSWANCAHWIWQH